MSHQEDQTSTTSATSATSAQSAQSAQSPGSEQPDLPPYYCNDPRAYCPLCGFYIGDAYCKNPDCGRDRRDNFLDSADAMGKLIEFHKMISQQLLKETKPTESDNSSNKLTVHCGSGPGRFCLNDTLLQQPQMLELPEGASWDTCSCGNRFVLGISDNVSANYCSQYCYDRR